FDDTRYLRFGRRGQAGLPSDLKDAGRDPARTGRTRPGRQGQAQDKDVAGIGRVNDRIDPTPGRGVTDVGLAVVTTTQVLGERRHPGVVHNLTLPLEGGDVDVEHRPRGLVGPHHGVAGAGPGEEETRVERPA